MQTDYLKQRGARLVSYCCGFEYVHAMESMLFNKPLWGQNLFVNQRYDDIWMILSGSVLAGVSAGSQRHVVHGSRLLL
jgi:hypothetical protein